jgi:hypothetical protein
MERRGERAKVSTRFFLCCVWKADQEETESAW